MTSLSPLATNVGWVIRDRSCRLAEAGFADRQQLRDPGLMRDGLVAIGRALTQRAMYSVPVCLPTAFVEEQELPRVEARHRGLGVGAADDQRHLGQAPAAAMPGAGENQPPDQVRVLQGDLLRDTTTEGEAEQVDVVVAERPMNAAASAAMAAIV
jgi:hypothetical protein